jgi:hypothetical protein
MQFFLDLKFVQYFPTPVSIVTYGEMRDFKIPIYIVPTTVTCMKHLVHSCSFFSKSRGSTPNRVEIVNDEYENTLK